MGIEATLNQTSEAQTLRQTASHHSAADGSQPSSLWESAYEHRVAVGLGVAAAGAALYLSRGRIANLFAPRSQEVLLVEAAPFMGKAMRHSLQEAGHKVTWVTEIDKLRPLTGLTESGAEVSIKMGRFHTAFIDPNHVTKGAIGFEKLAPFFHQGNVRTIGTSVMPDMNARMLSEGVDIASSKSTVLMSLVGKNLNLQQAVRSPGRTQAMLSTLEGNINSAELAGLRQKTSDLITRFMLN